MSDDNLTNVDIKGRYYYIYDEQFHLKIATIYVIIDDNKIKARGIAICSLMDQFNKKKGRNIAKGRALKAMTTNQSSSWINIERADLGNLIDSKNIKSIPKGIIKNTSILYLGSLIFLSKKYDFVCKSEFSPRPTTRELRFLKPKEPKE